MRPAEQGCWKGAGKGKASRAWEELCSSLLTHQHKEVLGALQALAGQCHAKQAGNGGRGRGRGGGAGGQGGEPGAGRSSLGRRPGQCKGPGVPGVGMTWGASVKGNAGPGQASHASGATRCGERGRPHGISLGVTKPQAVRNKASDLGLLVVQGLIIPRSQCWGLQV